MPQFAATEGWRTASTSSAGTPPKPRPHPSPPASDCRTGRSPSRWARSRAASVGGWSWPGSCSAARRRCCWTSRPTTSTPTPWPGCGSSCAATAAAWQSQADRMRAKATKAKAAQGMARRAERLLAGLEEVRQVDRVARLRFPEPAPCGRTPLTATGLSKSYGSLEVFTDVDLAVDRGARVVILGLNGAGKTTLLRLLAGIDSPDTGTVTPGHGLRLGYYAQEHETLDTSRNVLENMRAAARTPLTASCGA